MVHREGGGRMKEKTEKRGFIKAVFYAVKIIMKCSPGFITVQLFSMISSWFFTGFVQEILFLRMVLKIIEGGGTYKDFVFTVIMFAAAGILSKFGNNFFDWIWNMKSKKFYMSLKAAALCCLDGSLPRSEALIPPLSAGF